MAASAPFTYVEGANRAPVTITRGRNASQRATVALIVADPSFSHAVGSNPFTTPVLQYPDGRVVGGTPLSGPFHFLWYDTDDRLNAAYIERDGQISRSHVTPAKHAEADQ